MRPIAIRAHPLVFGTIVFLASESMLFAGLLAGYYYLRGYTSPWPPTGTNLDFPGMALGTGLLGFGSVTMVVAQTAAQRKNRIVARAMLVVTILAALGFLYLELNDYYEANFWIDSGAYGTMYYTITGTHFVHVVVGVVLLTAVTVFLRERAFTRAHHAGVEAVAYYWHFVFAVWCAVYATIFLVK
jgi:heme/copper-type cytochrome/quinol oxidase subunit 3